MAGVKWLVRGGEHWSDSIGKECPSDPRIAQFVNEMIPALNAPDGEDWLTMATAQDVQNAVSAAVKTALGADIVPNTEYREDLTRLNPQDLSRVALEGARASIDVKGQLDVLATAVHALTVQTNALQAALTQLAADVAKVLPRFES